MDSWHVDLISSSFILLVLKPEIRIIPVFFFFIASLYVVNLSSVNFLPDRALILFGSKSLLGSGLDVASRIGFVLDALLGLSSLFDSELGTALGTAPGDIVTLGTGLGETPRLGQELGTRLGLSVVVDAGLDIALGLAYGDVVALGNELGESRWLSMSLSPS